MVGWWGGGGGDVVVMYIHTHFIDLYSFKYRRYIII